MADVASSPPGLRDAADGDENIYEVVVDPCSSSGGAGGGGGSTYGRIGNAYGRIDVIGHGIGRIERHLSSSCGSINSSSGCNHYALESLYGGSATVNNPAGRISKVSVQWLLANKWLPLWIANTETGRDYRIIDFLLAQTGEDSDGEDERVEKR